MGWFTRLKEASNKVKSIIKPYFSPQTRTERIILGTAIAGSHLLELGIGTYFISQASSNQADNSTDWQTDVNNLVNIAFAGSLYAFNITFRNYMTHSVQKSLLETNILNGSLKDNTSVAMESVQASPEGKEYALSADKTLERIAGEYFKNFSSGSVRVVLENFNRVLSILTEYYVIFRLTNGPTATLYLVSASTFTAICSNFENARNKLSIEDSKLDDALGARITHNRQHGPEILALDGQAREIEELKEILDKKHKIAKRIMRYDFRNNMLLYTAFFGLSAFLTALTKLASSVFQTPNSNSVTGLLFLQYVFQLLINCFFIMENYTLEFPKWLATLDTLYSFQKLLALCETMRANKDLVSHLTSSSTLILENLNVNLPLRAQDSNYIKLLENANLTLEAGMHALKGPSNAGKSTLFKTIMGLWTHASGTITLPDETHYIPQETFIPFDPSLLDIIIYPKKDSPAIDREEISDLMKELNLSHLLKYLNQGKLDLKTLSRGEQQRLAIIRAILSRAKLLLMDEATASMDKNNKGIAYELIKRYLRGAVILIIDHSPLKESIAAIKTVKEIPKKEVVIDINENKSINIEMTERKTQAPLKLFDKPKNINNMDVRINAETKKLEFVEQNRKLTRSKSFS